MAWGGRSSDERPTSHPLKMTFDNHIKRMSVVGSALLVVTTCRMTVAQPQFPSKESMAGWAKNLEDSFGDLLSGDEDVTGATVFTRAYQDNFKGEILHANGKEIVEEMRTKMTEVFDKNIEAVKNLQKKAESLIEKYEFDYTKALKDVDYVNVNNVSGSAMAGMTRSDHFKQDVNFNLSGVHVPLEIYEGYPVILNGIDWSTNLTEAFIQNRKDYPDIYWQSYGSQDGFLRTYPLTEWKTVDDLPDLYDVRRRPWYIHGTSSPKDMVILLDTSGSMHGQSFDIMKLAAKTLINTLGENDFVNVAMFAKQVDWVTPCLNTLVQANTRNKRLLFDGIDQLEARHVANYSEGLEFAYSALEDFEGLRAPEDESGANCHKLIMIFSDGGTEYPQEIISVYTNETRTITRQARIFTYAVGPHPLPTVALKNMACRTKGAFDTITAMGAIRTTIQESYVQIITRPEALSGVHQLQYSGVYGNALGLGFVTTVTLPVFNTSRHSDNQTLAGIVGIDIPILTFERFAPRAQLGPLGYAFALNTNGFLIFHPSLWMVDNYLEDPAHNDFADVEGDTQPINEIRKKMIDLAYTQDNDNINMSEVNTSAVVQHGHAVPVDLEYHYASVPGTNFSLGVVVPKQWKYLTLQTPVDLKEQLSQEEDAGKQVHLAPWNYCSENKEYVDSFKGISEAEKCTSDEASHLGFDLKVTRETFRGLQPPLSTGESNDNDNRFLSRFLITDGGLIRYTPQSSRRLYNLNPYNSSLYRMVSTSSDSSAVLYVQTHDRHHKQFLASSGGRGGDGGQPDFIGVDDEVDDSEKEAQDVESESVLSDGPVVYLAKRIPLKSADGAETTAGVAGVQMRLDYLQQLVVNATSSGVNTAGSKEYSCSDSENVRCYLIDLSGYVITSNQPMSRVSVGDFLGASDPDLMAHLVKERKLFDERSEYDYQGLCESKVDCSVTGAASDLPGLFVSHARSVLVTALQRLAGLAYQVNLTLLTAIIALYLPSPAEPSLLEFGNSIPDGLHRCTTRKFNWYLKSNAFASERQFEDSIPIFCSAMVGYTLENSAHLCKNDTDKEEDGEEEEEQEDTVGDSTTRAPLPPPVMEKKCHRLYHLYKSDSLNAMLIVAEPPLSAATATGAYDLFSDTPVEVSGSDCLLPNRYRQRPKLCYAQHEDEKTCSSGGVKSIASSTKGIILSGLVALAATTMLV